MQEILDLDALDRVVGGTKHGFCGLDDPDQGGSKKVQTFVGPLSKSTVLYTQDDILFNRSPMEAAILHNTDPVINGANAFNDLGQSGLQLSGNWDAEVAGFE